MMNGCTVMQVKPKTDEYDQRHCLHRKFLLSGDSFKELRLPSKVLSTPQLNDQCRNVNLCFAFRGGGEVLSPHKWLHQLP